MSDKPKPGGRIDRAALARATRMNRQIARQMCELASRQVSMERLFELVYLTGLDLAEQRDALAIMANIRRHDGKQGDDRDGT